MISQLDRGTLDVVTMLVAIVPCCVAISIWRINRALEGPLFWMLAITLTLLTYAAVPLLQVLGAPPGVAVAMNNTSSLTSMLLLLEGNLRFTGRVSSARLKWGVLAVLLFLTLSILNRDDAARRYLFHDPIAAGLLLANAATLLLRPPASERGVMNQRYHVFMIDSWNSGTSLFFSYSPQSEKNHRMIPYLSVE
jgi:hypothetical protein